MDAEAFRCGVAIQPQPSCPACSIPQSCVGCSWLSPPFPLFPVAALGMKVAAGGRCRGASPQPLKLSSTVKCSGGGDDEQTRKQVWPLVEGRPLPYSGLTRTQLGPITLCHW